MAVRASDRELDQLGLSMCTIALVSPCAIVSQCIVCCVCVQVPCVVEMMLYNFAAVPGIAHAHAVRLCEPVLAEIEEIKGEKTSNVKQPGLRVLRHNIGGW